MDSITIDNKNKKAELAKYGLVAAAGTGAILMAMEEPASATASPIESISSTVTALGGITAAIVAIVLGVMGFRVGVKMFNRLSVKG